MKTLAGLLLFFFANAAFGSEGDLLIKFSKESKTNLVRLMGTLPQGSEIEDLGLGGWTRIQVPPSQLRNFSLSSLQRDPSIVHIQPNYRIRALENPSLAQLRERLAQLNPCPTPEACDTGDQVAADNPPIPAPGDTGNGNDPMINQQWGMLDIGARSAWQKNKGNKDVVVAVIDTGVDYTHEDLRGNLWRNAGEMGTDSQGRDKATNGVDDDGNGYIDDLIGWDFVSNDNKPFDLSVSMFELLTGGNPGHGTHCAGNVAARGFNGKGISGVAPNVSIMSIRFLSEKGQGTTADAVKAVMYAVANRAHILSNSWGSEGEDKNDPANEALKDAIRYAEAKGALFVAAAGNGHNGIGYDNDSDSRPAFPASYDMDIIVSVAALDSQGQLGSFSNWGRQSVDIGAPGVKVFSTTVGGKYSDTVIDFLGMTVTWDGTSMATPHVAGAAALFLSQNPNATWRQIKDALLSSSVPIPSLNGKVVSNGKLNVDSLLSL